jgi:hypothetical protein
MMPCVEPAVVSMAKAGEGTDIDHRSIPHRRGWMNPPER